MRRSHVRAIPSHDKEDNPILRRLQYLFRRRQFDHDLDQEIQFHIEARADELVAAGLAPDQALAQARREFGPAARIGERTREAWQLAWLEDLLRDLRHSARSLRRDPGFAITAILSLALGIGANTVVFSLVKAVLLSGLEVREPDRLVSLHNPAGAARISYPDFEDYRAQVAAFQDAAATYAPIAKSLGAGSRQRLVGQVVSTNYFNVLGAEPALGRGFLTGENNAYVTVISHSLWTREFASDRSVVGRTIQLGGLSFQVIGIAPPRFGGSIRGMSSDFWMPLGLSQQLVSQLGQGTTGPLESSRRYPWLYLTARLKPGITRPQADASLRTVAARLDAEHARGSQKRSLHLESADALAIALTPARTLLATLMIVVALVLMVACANVANLQLSRSAARRHEIGVRLAIGAGRSRLIRQLLTESALLASAGAAAAIGLTVVCTNLLGKLQSALPYPIALDLTIDWRVLSFAAVVAVAATALSGLAPAITGTRVDVTCTIREAAFARRRFAWKNSQVVFQIAVSVVLLVASGLFLRSLHNSALVPLGLDARNVLLLTFDPRAAGLSNEQAATLFGELLERVRALSIVASAGLADSMPLSIFASSVGVARPGLRDPVITDIYGVSSQYFATLGIPILQGRDFDRAQRTPLPPAVINEQLAGRLYANQNPVGLAVDWEGMPHQVIAVAGNAKSRTATESARPQIFVPLESEYKYFWGRSGVVLTVKSVGPPAPLAVPIRNLIQALHPALTIDSVRTMEDHISNGMLVPRLCSILFGAFGAIGLSLAMVGLYGVVSYSVRRRTREIGIRLAVGARPSDVLLLLSRQGFLLTGIGLAIGLAVAWTVSRVARSFLYGVDSRDVATFAAMAILLLATATLAILVPTGRAARMDALRSIRHE